MHAQLLAVLAGRAHRVLEHAEADTSRQAALIRGSRLGELLPALPAFMLMIVLVVVFAFVFAFVFILCLSLVCELLVC